MMWWYDNGTGMNGWGYVLMTVGMVMFWGFIIVVVIALTRSLGRTDRSTAVSRLTPEQVLADRFAHGQIDEHEYHTRLDTLRAAPRPL